MRKYILMVAMSFIASVTLVPIAEGGDPGGIPDRLEALELAILELVETVGEMQDSLGAAVPQSGQIACWDVNGDEIPCSGTGHDGDLRKGSKWPYPRFVVHDDGTVSDSLSGLMWLQDAGCFGWDVTWSDSFFQIEELNSGVDKGCMDYSPGTYSDWRLPNIREILSLVDWGTGPGLPTDHPFEFGAVGGCNYWSSTTVWAHKEEAWSTIFGSHTNFWAVFGSDKTGDFCIWPVRGGF